MFAIPSEEVVSLFQFSEKGSVGGSSYESAVEPQDCASAAADPMTPSSGRQTPFECGSGAGKDVGSPSECRDPLDDTTQKPTEVVEQPPPRVSSRSASPPKYRRSQRKRTRRPVSHFNGPKKEQTDSEGEPRPRLSRARRPRRGSKKLRPSIEGADFQAPAETHAPCVKTENERRLADKIDEKGLPNPDGPCEPCEKKYGTDAHLHCMKASDLSKRCSTCIRAKGSTANCRSRHSSSEREAAEGLVQLVQEPRDFQSTAEHYPGEQPHLQDHQATTDDKSDPETLDLDSHSGSVNPGPGC